MQKEQAYFDTRAPMEKDHGKIASVAFALYEQRGREDGHDLDDWLEAEQRIVRRGEGRGFEAADESHVVG